MTTAAHVERPAPPGDDERVQLGILDRGRLGLAAVHRGRDRLLGLQSALPGVPRAAGRARLLFALAAVLYPVHQLLTRGRLHLGGAMWAEMGTNYYATSIAPSTLEQLFAPDAGYIPLPQRLIAFAGNELGLPPSAVPYLYTGSAIVLAGLLIACFCLPVFRPAVASDGLRFLLAVALVLVPDYETRTFINFTYFAVIPAVALTALAAVQRDREVPGWAWILPVFMLSKPGVLAVLPAMLLVSVVSRRRFRRIAVVSALAGLIQVVRLAQSTGSGQSLLQASDESLFSKVYATIKYSLGLLGRLLTGPEAQLGTYPWMFWGIGLLLVCAVAVALLRSRAAPLVVIGLSLVLFTMLVNCFTFSAAFNRDMALLAIPGLDRRFVVAVIGVLFVAVALVAMVFESPLAVGRLGRWDPARVARGGAVLGAALFALWFGASGWLHYTSLINRPFGVPVGNVSQWQEMSPLLASAERVVCVPLNPFGWHYGRNCGVLRDENATPFYFGWSATTATDEEDWIVDLSVPAEVRRGQLASLALMVQPPPGIDTVTARGFVVDRDGTETVLAGQAELPPDGGLLQLVAAPTPLVAGVSSVQLRFNQPIRVAALDPSDTDSTILLWMGQPGPQR